MVINIYLEQLNLKKETKQIRRTETDRFMDTESVLTVARWEGAVGGMGEEVRGLRSTNRQLQNSHGDVNYGIGNREAKELICVTHGHELRGGMLEGRGVHGRRGIKGRKIWTTVIA